MPKRLRNAVTTFKQAAIEGWTIPRPEEYGGETLIVKGRKFIKNPETAISESAWGKLGFRIKPDQLAHATISGRVGGRSRQWDVFRKDQVEPKRVLQTIPPRAVPILLAVWTVNRRAKRYRDASQNLFQQHRHSMAGEFSRRKAEMYRLKSQCLAHLVNEGILTVAGVHLFADGQWAELLEGDGFCFHRPCVAPIDVGGVKKLTLIESKPQDKSEPRLKDAVHTIELYLAGKPQMQTFDWPVRIRKAISSTVFIDDVDDVDDVDENFIDDVDENDDDDET